MKNKSVANLEGADQESTVHRASPLPCELNEVSDDAVSIFYTGLVIQSHPSCPRQRCRLWAKPHRIPIRLFRGGNQGRRSTPSPCI